MRLYVYIYTSKYVDIIYICIFMSIYVHIQLLKKTKKHKKLIINIYLNLEMHLRYFGKLEQISFSEIPYIDLLWRSLLESLYRSLAKRPLIEILYGDIA